MSLTKPSGRIEYLDSVRGLAAFAVVIYHFIGWTRDNDLNFHIAAIFFNGSDAVSLFFVLSGLVLSRRYFTSGKGLVGFSYKKYLIERIFRLYPAYLVAVMANYLYGKRIFKALTVDLFNNQGYILHELSLIRGHHDHFGAGWTLDVEMAISLLLPVFVLAILHSPRFLAAFAMIIFVLGPGHISNYAVHFCLGIFIAYYFDTIQNYDARQSKYWPWRYLIYIGIFVLFSIRHIERIFPVSDGVRTILTYFNLNDFFAITGMASAMILVLIINRKSWQRWLEIKPLLFLGRISYSLYLSHWLVVNQMYKRWDETAASFSSPAMHFTVMLIIYLAIVFAVSIASYYLIEKPTLKWGKIMSKKAGGRR